MPTILTQSVVETTLGNHDGDFDDVRTELTQLRFQGIDNCVSELQARYGLQPLHQLWSVCGRRIWHSSRCRNSLL